MSCSKPILKMPKPLPPIVKQYKHKIIRGDVPGMQKTGIYLEEGDVYSILAAGSIDLGLRSYDVMPGDARFLGRIDKNHHFPAIFRLRNADMHTAYDSGKLYLGIKDGQVNRFGEPYRPERYRDNTGSLRVDIIVWKRKDYVQIAGFLEEMKQKYPENVAIIDALNDANRQKEIYLAKAKTSKEIEETKKEIQKLKEESDSGTYDLEAYDAMTYKELHLASTREETEKEKDRPIKTAPGEKPAPRVKPPATEMEKHERIAQLEAKLAKLTEALDQLEEMKKKFEEERKRTSLLSKELEEKERREKDLLSRLEHAEKIPPVIVVAAPKDGIEVEVGTITFSGVAEDDLGLEGLDMFINDIPLLAKASGDIKLFGTKRPGRLEFAERISLQRGKNEIRIRAIDTDGLTAEKVLTVHYREIRKNVWAVVIGIDRYQNTRHLKYAVNDAQAFYDHLIRNNRIPEENVILMVNEKAGLTRLRSVLGTHLKNKAGKEDMVIIFFAGHGACEKDVTSPDKDGLEKYILPYDANPRDLYATALPMSEVSRIVNRIGSERLIFIVDACYSGASGGRTISLTGVRANISEGFLDRIVSGKGRVILTASGPNEVSGEDDELKHGVFTYFLLEGLRGKADTDRDGIITVDEAYRYVSREVPRATGQEQHPVKKGIVEGQLILGVIE